MMRALLLLVLLPSVAQAFDYSAVCGGQPLRWRAGSVESTWRWASSYPSNDIPASTAKSILSSAFTEWGEPGCSSFDAVQGSDLSNTDPGGNSSSHLVGFYESGWPSQWGSSTLAITLVQYGTQDCLMDNADMVFNGQDWQFGTSANGRVDMQAVATHEAGHWVGLDHSNYPGSSLNASWSGTTTERTLTCDDTEGVCGSHPSGQITCSEDRHCSCGVSCEGGQCVGDSPVDPDPTPGSCGGTPVSLSESEPNDWEAESDIDEFVPSSNGDISISGTVTCGNNGESYTADIDFFAIQLGCQDTARFRLDWDESADLDFAVWSTSSNDPIALDVEAGNSGPAQDTAAASGVILGRVTCWEGSTADYTFTVDWPPYSSDGGTDPVDPNDPCEGLDSDGECVGDVARWCQNDALQTYDCADEGGCGWTDQYGYWCLGSEGGPDTGEPIGDLIACSCNNTSGQALWLAPFGLIFPALVRRRRSRPVA